MPTAIPCLGESAARRGSGNGSKRVITSLVMLTRRKIAHRKIPTRAAFLPCRETWPRFIALGPRPIFYTIVQTSDSASSNNFWKIIMNTVCSIFQKLNNQFWKRFYAWFCLKHIQWSRIIGFSMKRWKIFWLI